MPSTVEKRFCGVPVGAAGQVVPVAVWMNPSTTRRNVRPPCTRVTSEIWLEKAISSFWFGPEFGVSSRFQGKAIVVAKLLNRTFIVPVKYRSFAWIGLL